MNAPRSAQILNPMSIARQSPPRISLHTLWPLPTQQCRHASLLRRPKRPYTFTQLITLSDGSTFVHRTTSPVSLYKSNKDARNSPLWNPHLSRLLNVEEDEAGRLRKFRERFGRGWDAEAATKDESTPENAKEASTQDAEDHLMSLITNYGKNSQGTEQAKKPSEKPASQTKDGK